LKASERIRLSVEDRIRDGAWLPGDPIDEASLMRDFGVSRTPVREAMLQLQAQGLLVSLPRGGVVVARMTFQELFAMWELMADLEVLCARYACERMTDDERQDLVVAHERGRDVVRRDEADGWREANMAFHEVLYKGARNPYLRQEILRMRARTAAYRRHAFGVVGHILHSHETHGAVVAAVVAKDPQAAAAAMQVHIGVGRGGRAITDLILKLPKHLLA
jgi:DNA-binding GntR family transcriptional regulator